jgi:formylglycine-generating enzyme required for sulfatase activity
MTRIFISYRREDSRWPADRLYKILKPMMEDPERDIFIDIDNVPFGIDFVDHLESQVAQCDVVLALIGPKWLDATGKDNKRRLDDPKDFVRIEIASALKRGIRVVPVLLDGTAIPPEDALPEDLKPLSHRNGIPLDPLNFDAGVKRLVHGLSLSASGRFDPRRLVAAVRRAPLTALVIAVVALLAIVVGTTILRPGPKPSSSGTSVAGLDPELPITGEGATVAAVPGNLKETYDSLPDARTAKASLVPPVIEDAQVSWMADFAMFRECETCPAMVALPAGSFGMGASEGDRAAREDETPRQVIAIGRFAISRFETTYEEWLACSNAGFCDVGSKNGAFGCDTKSQAMAAGQEGWDNARAPVINVDWCDVGKFASYVNANSHGGYRRVTEAEWEYAARAGKASVFPWGAQMPECNAASARGARFGACTPKGISDVGSFKANPFGLYDMTGNVWEWVEDCYRPNLEGQPANGAAYVVGDCKFRVNRGGAWDVVDWGVRPSIRNKDTPNSRVHGIGFRLARRG